MKKTLSAILYMLVSINYLYGQILIPEKRIYLLDVTASMSGYGVGNDNIFDSVKQILAQTIEETDSLTEIVIVPFTDKTFNPICGDKSYLIKSINGMKPKSGNTDILKAWNKGISLIDSTKLNYLFLLTDGCHNSGADNDSLYASLRKWSTFSYRKPYYAFYLMLTNNAKDDIIRNIADSIPRMWNVETLHLDVTTIKSPDGIKRFNVFGSRRIMIPIECNHMDSLKSIKSFNLKLDPNRYYKINKVKLITDSKKKNRAWISFVMDELVAKNTIPSNFLLNARITYDVKKSPRVFFTPNFFEFEIQNYGKKKMSLTLNDSNDNTKLDFGSVRFREPFCGILSSRPKILVKSLGYWPFSAFVPDTSVVTKTLNISFNNECRRFGATQSFLLRNNDNKKMKDVFISVDSSFIFKDDFKVSVHKKSNVKVFKRYLSIKVLPLLGDTILTGYLVAADNSVDEVNGVPIELVNTPVIPFQVKQETAINWWLWILWGICLIITLVICIVFTMLVIRLICKVFTYIYHQISKKVKYYCKPIEKTWNDIDPDIVNMFSNVDYSQAYLDYLNAEFERLTQLSDQDYTFVLFATALQSGRWIMLQKIFGDLGVSSVPRISDKDGNDLKYSTLSNFQKKAKEHKNILGSYPSWEDILWGNYPRVDGGKSKHLCPYDAQKNAPEWFNEFGKGAHRQKTLGHDPILGWIFGTANILTQTITLSNFDTYKVTFPGNCFGEKISTAAMFLSAMESVNEDLMRLPAAIVAHYAHLKSDIITSAGLPIPLSPLMNGCERNKFVKQISGGLYRKQYDLLTHAEDLVIIGKEAKWANLINLFVTLIHGLYYDETIDKDRGTYEYRTSKIIDISSGLASFGNVAYSILTTQWTKFDLGGIYVTIKNLNENQHYRTKIKEEYLRKNLNSKKRKCIFCIKFWIYNHLCQHKS